MCFNIKGIIRGERELRLGQSGSSGVQLLRNGEVFWKMF